MDVHLHITTKIIKACTKGEAPWVSPATEGVYLQATDGRVAAIVCCKGNATEKSAIPVDVVPTTKKGGRVYTEGDTWKNNHGKYAKAEGGVRDTPSLDQVFPNTSQGYRVTLNPALLKDLAEAIGAEEGVTLFVPEDGKGPIGVCSAYEEGPDAIGVIMPIKPSDTAGFRYTNLLKRYRKDLDKK